MTAPTWTRWSTLCRIAVWVVRSASATTRRPSTRGATTSVSASPRIGGRSTMTKSNASRARFRSSANLGDSSNSAGCEVGDPLGTTRRLSPAFLAALSNDALPARRSLSPGSSSSAKYRCSLGLRRSAGIDRQRDLRQLYGQAGDPLVEEVPALASVAVLDRSWVCGVDVLVVLVPLYLELLHQIGQFRSLVVQLVFCPLTPVGEVRTGERIRRPRGVPPRGRRVGDIENERVGGGFDGHVLHQLGRGQRGAEIVANARGDDCRLDERGLGFHADQLVRAKTRRTRTRVDEDLPLGRVRDRKRERVHARQDNHEEGDRGDQPPAMPKDLPVDPKVNGIVGRGSVGHPASQRMP